MSDQSTNLQLPYLAAAQAQKHVTLNTALLRLDALVQGNVISRVVAAQPASPSDGELYIVPAGKTGADWGAYGNFSLAYYRDGVWEEIKPRTGWTVFVKDEAQHVVFSGAAWGAILASAQTAGFRNRLINSAFAVNQRAATSCADDTYCFDRWYVLTQAAAVAPSALTDPETGRPTGIRLTQSQASAQRFGLAQIVPAANIKDLRLSAAAMAARIRCSSAQAIGMAILEWTGSADAVTSDVVNDWTDASYTPGHFFVASNLNVIAHGALTPSAAAWTDMTPITGSFGASLNNAIVMAWTQGVAAQNVTLDLDQAQLEAGPLCGAFARRPYGEELALCQRYFFRRAFAANDYLAGMQAYSSSQVFGKAYDFPVTMRAAPTMTMTPAHFSAWNAAASSMAAFGSGNMNPSTPWGAASANLAGASGLAAGDCAQVVANQATNVDADAEL